MLKKVIFTALAGFIVIGCGGGSGTTDSYLPTKIDVKAYDNDGSEVENRVINYSYNSSGYLLKEQAKVVGQGGNDYECKEYIYNKELLKEKLEFDNYSCDKSDDYYKLVYSYNSKSLLEKRERYTISNGNTSLFRYLTFSYFGNNKLKEVKVNGNNFLSYSYPDSKTIEIEQSNGNIDKYLYNSKKELIEYWNDGSLDRKYKYNSKGYVSYVNIPQRGIENNFNYKYDKNGNVEKIDITQNGTNVKKFTIAIKWKKFSSSNIDAKERLLNLLSVQRPFDDYAIKF